MLFTSEEMNILPLFLFVLFPFYCFCIPLTNFNFSFIPHCHIFESFSTFTSSSIVAHSLRFPLPTIISSPTKISLISTNPPDSFKFPRFPLYLCHFLLYCFNCKICFRFCRLNDWPFLFNQKFSLDFLTNDVNDD